MVQHIIPQDSYNHIQDIACGCNPIVTIVEGEEVCYHSEIVEEIPLKNMEEVSRFLEEI